MKRSIGKENSKQVRLNSHKAKPLRASFVVSSPILTPAQVESALKHILTSTLALFVLNNSKPVSRVIAELMDAEYKAGQLVGLGMRLQADMKSPDLEGTLAGIFSFIPFPTPAKVKTTNSERSSKALKRAR